MNSECSLFFGATQKSCIRKRQGLPFVADLTGQANHLGVTIGEHHQTKAS